MILLATLFFKMFLLRIISNSTKVFKLSTRFIITKTLIYCHLPITSSEVTLSPTSFCWLTQQDYDGPHLLVLEQEVVT